MRFIASIHDPKASEATDDLLEGQLVPQVSCEWGAHISLVKYVFSKPDCELLIAAGRILQSEQASCDGSKDVCSGATDASLHNDGCTPYSWRGLMCCMALSSTPGENNV